MQAVGKKNAESPEAGTQSAHMTFHSDNGPGNVVLTVEEAAVG